MDIFKFKDRRSKSCLARSAMRYDEEHRPASLLEKSQSRKFNKTLNSSTESSQRHSTPKHMLHKKESYQNTKERMTSEVDHILKNSSVTIVSGWLKVQGTFRDWTRLWAVLKPGLLLFYRDSTWMNGVWLRTIVLSSCQVSEHPSKRAGFYFKISHPLEKSIWTQRGPNNEQSGGFTFPLPGNYLICRATDARAGHCWMNAFELSMNSSKLLRQPCSSNDENSSFTECELDLSQTLRKESRFSAVVEDDRIAATIVETNESDIETPYILAPAEEMGELGNAAQTEQIVEENQSVLMHLLKQVRPGMDLSRVVLPTFILEPRSLLEKFSDYYHHCDLLEEAANSSDPLIRMKTVVKFYLSGFYKKSKGLKKPYNPVLGEVYRCYFHHPRNNSKTFYIAEQISHHPSITNFYISNRREGFSVQGSILTRSKFYGNSLSAILDGTARISLFSKDEDYLITMPYANCKGLLMGRLTMELGGSVTILCKKTGYSVEIEFKLKPFIGGQELTNLIEGKIRLEKDVLYTFSGHWDNEIILRNKATNTESILWKVTPAVINSRLKRYVVPLEEQEDHESEKLWQYVTSAIQEDDQILATQEKANIENEQRRRLKEYQTTGAEWQPCLSRMDTKTKEWTYIHADSRPWDIHNDITTYENNFIIHTRAHHQHSNIHAKSSTANRKKSSISDQDIIPILKPVETNLLHANEQSNCFETHTHPVQNLPSIHSISPYIQLVLVLAVAIVLKYIFS